MKKSIKVVGFTLPDLKAYYESTKNNQQSVVPVKEQTYRLIQQNRVSRSTFIHLAQLVLKIEANGKGSPFKQIMLGITGYPYWGEKLIFNFYFKI